ncbi:MAG TPA: ATP-binding protein [Acidisarcina sp.]
MNSDRRQANGIALRLPEPDSLAPGAELLPFIARRVQIRDQQQRMSKISLEESFAEFIAASARLEASYRDLQQDVSTLNQELAERNAALSSSRAENEQIQRSLESVIDSMPCGVLLVDEDGTVLTINPEGRRQLGIDRCVIRRGPSITRLTEVRSLQHLDLRRFYGPSATDNEQEFAVAGPAGKVWFELRTRSLGTERRSHGRKTVPRAQTILILRDITAQKRMEQEREAALRAMTLAEITTVLAHEIRNPLASLELFVGLIAQDGVTSPAWVSHLRAGIRSLSGTVNNVLSFHGACSMRLSPVNLGVSIAAAVEFVRPLGEQAGVEIRSTINEQTCGAEESASSLCALASESAIQQVVLNLVANAIRHTPADGTLDISMLRIASPHKKTSHVIVRFRDSGCGISAASLDRIFEPGFSAAGDTPGLGLAVCRTIMEIHGGSIKASCDQDCGSTFELEFPLL